jgi:hypothetical protein
MPVSRKNKPRTRKPTSKSSREKQRKNRKNKVGPFPGMPNSLEEFDAWMKMQELKERSINPLFML